MSKGGIYYRVTEGRKYGCAVREQVSKASRSHFLSLVLSFSLSLSLTSLPTHVCLSLHLVLYRFIETLVVELLGKLYDMLIFSLY